MNGGDTDTGGAKVNPNNTPSPTPQPDANSTSDTEAESVLTISHDDHPSMSEPQLTPQSTTPEPVVPPISPAQSISSPTSTIGIQPGPNDASAMPAASTPQPATPPTNQPATSDAVSTTPLIGQSTPAMTDQPMQPIQSPQPLTSSIFPPQQPVQFPAQQPMSTSSEDVVLGTSSPKKSRKGLIITLVCLAILAIGAIIALVIFQASHNGSSDSQSSQNKNEEFSTKEELLDNLFRFNNQYYSNLIQRYNETIGLKPDMKMSKYDATLFPLETNMRSLATNLEDTVQAYNELSPKLPDQLDNGSIKVQPTKEKILQSLQAMDTNISILNKFHNAYVVPLVKESRPTSCTKTPAIISLEQGDTAEAAQKYFIVYCQAIEFLKQSEDYEALKQDIRPAADSATESLNHILIEVTSAEDDISKLLKELTE